VNKLIKLRTLYKLGVLNILRVVVYRLSLKFKFSSIRRIKAEYLDGAFFCGSTRDDSLANLSAFDGWNRQRTYYSFHKIDDDSMPEWHRHPFTNTLATNYQMPWWQIPDFDPEVGDIKSIWESSRFDWVLGFVQHGVSSPKDIDYLNQWLADWCNHNQPYLGFNWKCGQEASIRLIHLAIAASIMKQVDNPEPALVRLIEVHLTRIEPTISYAIAQNNNHGTSEAAALYIGGSWLTRLGISSGKKYQQLGVKWLEDRADHLILEDGTFSQYSINYHRLMLDTYSVVEIWRTKNELPLFSDTLYKKLSLATDWLFQFANKKNGHVPLLGSNDGARLLPLGNSGYSDFRPSVQLACALFFGRLAYSSGGAVDDYLDWLEVAKPYSDMEIPVSKSLAFGGYELLRQKDCLVVFNIPKFKFRPCQSDLLHVDFWYKDQNILRDGGTYSYNCDEETQSYFSGVRSHNSIQFDHRDQMPKLSRFLFGDWPEASELEPLKVTSNNISSAAAYKDYLGAYHHRSVALGRGVLTVIDTIDGFKSSAILRWRLPPGSWSIDIKKHCLSSNEFTVQIECSSQIERFELVGGEESHFYQHKTELPVLEIEVKSSCTMISKLEFMP